MDAVTNTSANHVPSTHSGPPVVASAAVRQLRLWSLAALVAIALQFALAMIILAHDNDTLISIHGGIGYLSVLITIVAAVVAWKVAQHWGSKGIFFHALSLPILCLVQIGIIEAHQKWVHVVVGVLYLVAVAGLFAMARRRS